MARRQSGLDGAHRFYAESMQLLGKHDVPFVVGGAYAMAFYTGIKRDTKDLDLCLRPEDIDLTLKLFKERGYRVDRKYPHWLGKIYHDDNLIDLIYRAGNGLCEVDHSWMERGVKQELLGCPVRIAAPEELIWMKAYIMERERYDGADVTHLLLSCADRIDWKHLLQRFGPDWPVLLSHLVLFSYVYPSERQRLPSRLIEELVEKVRADQLLLAPDRICRGTLLSRAQYLVDVEERGFRDARLDTRCQITAEELKFWTERIPPESAPPITRVR